VTRGGTILLTLALLVSASAAQIDDRPPSARITSTDTIVAIAVDPADATRSILVGPSGQAYEREGDRWLRHREGGVAANVTGAARVGGDLMVAGVATPLYRRTKGTWFATRLGEDGVTLLGNSPIPALIVRRQVFVYAPGKDRWARVGTLPAFKKPFAVWASSTKSVWASTDQGLYRLKGASFARAGDPVQQLAGNGTAPWGVTPTGIRKLPSATVVPATLDGTEGAIVAAAGSGKELFVAIDVAGRVALARLAGNALTRVDDLPATSSRVAALAADAGGTVVVAFADGSVAVRTADAWKTSQVGDALPSHPTGPGPSRTR